MIGYHSYASAAEAEIIIDGHSGGRAFEGIGAVSAGASTRLLIDYPKRERDIVLDYLFKPKFSASLQNLKVEIGGDINSTDGAEPSWARTREEFEHPRPEYFERGYEAWMMREAQKRNPGIVLGSLQWGAPGWMGSFTSADNAEFIARFIKAMRDSGINISHQGLWNERADGWSIPWVKALRKILDKHDLNHVRIVAVDRNDANRWQPAKDLLQDAELRKIIYAVGAHHVQYQGWQSPPEAKELGMPIWAAEDGPARDGWTGAWHRLSITCSGSDAVAFIDGRRLTDLHVCDRTRGYVALGSSYDIVSFDNLSIKPIRPSRTADQCLRYTPVSAKASSQWSDEYAAPMAVDNDPKTWWDAAKGTSAGEWLELDFGAPVTFNQTVIQHFEDRITGYEILSWDSSAWRTICAGQNLDARKIDTFPAVTTSKVRLLIAGTNGRTPAVVDFTVGYCSRVH